jgi:RimJ/RimL family protein N-acetyltransferase
MIIQYPKKIVIKNGEEIILRLIANNDEDKLFVFFSNLPEEDRLFLKDDVTKRETIRQWVENIDYKSILPVIAEKDGRIIGDGTLHINTHGWSKHVGEIRLVVARDYQRQGLGSIIAKELIHNAVNMGLDKLMAKVMDKQKSAMNALIKLGFIQEAVLKNHVTDINGYKRNMIILSNHVDSLWHIMEDMIQDYRCME